MFDLPPFSSLENSSCAVPVKSTPIFKQACAYEFGRMSESKAGKSEIKRRIVSSPEEILTGTTESKMMIAKSPTAGGRYLK